MSHVSFSDAVSTSIYNICFSAKIKKLYNICFSAKIKKLFHQLSHLVSLEICLPLIKAEPQWLELDGTSAKSSSDQ